MRDKTQAEKLSTLTSLRFFAALAVFVYHAKLLEYVLKDYKLGDVGVDFFFILSGFIMTYVYSTKFVRKNRKTSLRFYAARFAKIYPIYLLTFLLATPNMLKSYGVSVDGVYNGLVAFAAAANLTLTQAYFPNNPAILYSFNNVSWTISVEALFYILFPFIMLKVNSKAKILKTRSLLITVSLLYLCMVLFNFGLPSDSYMPFPIIRLPEFLIGMSCAILYIRRTSVLTSLSTLKISFVEIAAIASVIGSLLLFPYLPEKTSIAVCLAPSMAFLILVFAYQKGIVSRLLSKKAAVYLGEISFSFYMIHMIILGKLNAIGDVSQTVLALAVTLIASAILYAVIEEPFRKRIKSLLDRQIEKRKKIISPAVVLDTEV